MAGGDDDDSRDDAPPSRPDLPDFGRGRRAVRDERPRRQVAVALGFDPGEDPAPKVMATGTGALAERLLELAFANGVKVREDADLAEILAAVEVGSIIPLEAFSAVAEIIAFLYRANAGLTEPGEGGVRHPRGLSRPIVREGPEPEAETGTDADDEPTEASEP